MLANLLIACHFVTFIGFMITFPELKTAWKKFMAADRQPVRPPPSPVYTTNYGDMGGRRIVAAYLMRSTFARHGQAHSAWLFVTDTGRVLVARGGAENEPRAEHFGSVLGPALNARYGVGSSDSTHDMGRLLVTTQELAEVGPRTADRCSPDEDRQTFTLDTVNFLSIVRGQGLIQIPGQVIGGLVTRSNVVITPIMQDRARAQALFDAALDVNRMLWTAPNSPMPSFRRPTAAPASTAIRCRR
jgi:hypothetical protein